MTIDLKENIPHGTKEYPYDQYHIHNAPHAFQVPVHWHEEFEIIYTLKGHLQIFVSGNEYTALPGDICLVNPRELHFMGSSDLSVSYYTLLFPMEFLSFQTIDHLESTFFRPLRNGQRSWQNQIKDQALQKELGPILDELIQINKKKTNTYELRTKILLLQFIETLLTFQHPISETASSKQGIMQKELLLYLQEHFTEKITLDQLSQEFHLSSKYLSRYFKEHFHLTFSSYIQHLRLTHAQKLLENTEKSVTEIALSSGFPNVSYFIRSFKESYGMSPLNYRKSR